MYPIFIIIKYQHQWNLKEPIGIDGRYNSRYGEIWLGCCKEDCFYGSDHDQNFCTYAIKYMPYNDEVALRQNTREDIINEITTHQLCATKGLCPELFDAWLSPYGGVMVMQVYDITVRQLLLKFSDPLVHKDILANIITLLDKLHMYGVYHGDLHLDNIMVNLNFNTNNRNNKYIDSDYKYYFIDFGKGGRFDDMKSTHILDDYLEISAHIQEMIDEYPDYEFDKLYETMKIYLKKFDHF